MLWEEKIEGFSIITHEGLTLLPHPEIGWTPSSGMWNTLRTLWVLNMETLIRIHESCKSQSHLEYSDIFIPTRHILQSISRTWKVDRVHVLPTVMVPTFSPSTSKNDDTWWDSQDTKTVYLWDSMDNQDRLILCQNLSQRVNGQYGKQGTKNGHHPYKRRSSTNSSTYTKTNKRNVGNSRSRDGDGKETFVPRNPGSCQKSYECWVKTNSDVPTGFQKSLTETIMTPQHNVGKDVYTVDLENNEKLYWLVTESGLLGSFGFESRT